MRKKKEEESKKAALKTIGKDVEKSRFTTPSLSEFPAPIEPTLAEFSPVKSISSGSDGQSQVEHIKQFGHGSYQQVTKPIVPVILNSQIEKSSFRTLMDNKSGDVRKGLANAFKTKKKKAKDDAARPTTSQTTRSGGFREPSYELEGRSMQPPPAYGKQPLIPEDVRHGAPLSNPPPLPAVPVYKEWLGKGLAPQSWHHSKIRQDPQLWDELGDVLVYTQHSFPSMGREDITASFRVQSHIIQGSHMNYLRNAMTLSKQPRMGMPPSPVGSPGFAARQPYQRRAGPHPGIYTPPASEYNPDSYDTAASYEIFLPLPSEFMNKSEAEILHFNVTSRNALAIICKASLVGKDLSKGLIEAQRRLEGWFGEEGYTAAGLLAEYLHHRELDDMRNNPAIAIAMMGWSESPGVRWSDMYRESFVHLAGMYGRTQLYSEFKTAVSRTTRELLNHANYNMQMRVKKAEDRLKDLDFSDLWPPSSNPPPSYGAFERIRSFFLSELSAVHGSWPPQTPIGEDYWLTRDVTQSLQKDFGALYDYLVDRDVEWDCVEERPGPKWGFKRDGKPIEGNSPDLPLTTLLLNWDNKEELEHIPAPYPLLPESIPVKQSSKDNLFKVNASKKPLPPKDDKMAQRKFALAYTQSTNIFKLDPDAPPNAWVESYMDFEKADQATSVDPRDARRGRWILIYGILQVLSGISVDTPRMKYPQVGFCYHISPSLAGVPPWDRSNEPMYEANYRLSYCWKARQSWTMGAPTQDLPYRMRLPPRSIPSRAPTGSVSGSEYEESDYGRRNYDPAPRGEWFPYISPKSPRRALRNHQSIRESERLNNNREREHLDGGNPNSRYSPGFERADEWSVAEESRMDMESRLENHQAYHVVSPITAEPRGMMTRNHSQTSDEISVNNRRDMHGPTSPGVRIPTNIRRRSRSPPPSETSTESRYERGADMNGLRANSRSGSRNPSSGGETPTRRDAHANPRTQRLEIENPRHHLEIDHRRRVPPQIPSGMSSDFSPQEGDHKGKWIDFDDATFDDGKLIYSE